MAPGRIEFVILRTGRSPPAALHHALLRRSCIRLQAGERLPGEDFHLSDYSRFQAHLSPLRGSANLTNLTQGSQSLALGLTLTAASQLVEGSRLISIGCDRIDMTVPGPRCPTTTRRHSCP
jgi:hypothetical protein